MSSQVDIANQALSKLGALPIVDFNDDTTEANQISTNYESIKKSVLRSFPWRCATRSDTLALLNVEEANTFWTHTFAWPEDCLRILDIIENAPPYVSRVVYESREKTVLTKRADIVAEYIADIHEPDFDAHVEQVLVWHLAKDLCYAITGSNTREQNLNAIYDRMLVEAKTTDRQEASHKTFVIDTLVRER